MVLNLLLIGPIVLLLWWRRRFAAAVDHTVDSEAVKPGSSALVESASMHNTPASPTRAIAGSRFSIASS